MDRLKQTGNSVGLNKTQQAYQKFLSALASSKTGQTYDSLQWAGENMLTLNNAKEAADVFNRILATFGQDQAFLAQPGGNTRILRTRLKLVAALRGQRDFTAAEALVDELLKENPRALEPRVEKAQLSEDMAMAGSGNWNAAYNRWRTLALQLEQMRPKPIEYFDAWYHAALALSMEKQTTKAKQILAGVMKLSPTVGGPEMKAKYVELLSSAPHVTTPGDVYQPPPPRPGSGRPGSAPHVTTPGDVYEPRSPGMDSHYCGYPTRDGTPCRRLVKGPGYCYQHQHR